MIIPIRVYLYHRYSCWEFCSRLQKIKRRERDDHLVVVYRFFQ